MKAFELMPVAKALLSYVGRLTIARISPVWGFSTIITARLRPAFCIAHSTALRASFCSFMSIVSWSELPGTICLLVWRTWTSRPRASTSTRLAPVDAAELVLVRRFDAGLAEQVVRQVALLLEDGELAGIDRTRVAHDLRHERAIEVLAIRLDRHDDAGQHGRLLGHEVGDVARDALGDPDEVVSAIPDCRRSRC